MLNPTMYRKKREIENRVRNIRHCLIEQIKYTSNDIVTFQIDYEQYSTAPETAIREITRGLDEHGVILETNVKNIMGPFYKLYILIINLEE